MSGKQIFGVILLVFGFSALLGLLGVHLGGLLSFVLGIFMVICGFRKWHEQSRVLGLSLLIFGGLLLLGSVPLLLSLFIGGILVYFGFQLIRHDRDSSPSNDQSSGAVEKAPLHDPFDEEWERMMKSAKT